MAYREQEEHPFRRRSMKIKTALFALLSDCEPVQWDAIFIVANEIGVAQSTMRNTINEGCDLGVFEKRGGKAGANYGHSTGPPSVVMTEDGRYWFERYFAELDEDGDQ